MSNKTDTQNNIPVLVTRGSYIYPKFERILEVGREKSVNAVKIAKKDFESKIVLVSQKNPLDENPKLEDIFTVGILAELNIEKEWDDNTFTVNFKAVSRVKITDFKETSKMYKAHYSILKSVVKSKNVIFEKITNILKKAKDVNELAINNEFLELIVDDQNNPSLIVDTLAQYIPTIPANKKQEILETLNVEKRLEIILEFWYSSNQNNELDNKINRKIKDHVDEQQKEFYLREKLKAIKEELGDSDTSTDMEKYRKRLNEEPFPKNIKEKVLSEISRFESLPSSSSESNIIRSYIDVIMSLPWYQKKEPNQDLKFAKEVLDKYHFGLKKVKERIIEFLAVKQKTKSMRGQIICFVGPPGVGKTSLAKLIAKATGLDFIKLSLGGVKDESEIRGHRKTYIGAMPGRIIQSMKKSKTINPVFLLDEIDKMASDSRGDPASAMLEVLDPEQNNEFSDHYIEENYDLSQVMFIATANYWENIPDPLYDRMEIIELSSYTELEKKQIGKKYLVSRVLEEHNLKTSELTFSESAIEEIIKYYTRESGVRQLKRSLESIARKFVVKLLNKELKNLKITSKNVNEYLGKRIFKYTEKNRISEIGVVTGLAYTQYGGDILPIEVTKFPGKGGLNLTGKLGDVMKESATIALGYLKANAKKFNIDQELFNDYDIHIHVPEGAVPKDGPSAGITITTAILSCLTKKSVSKNIAMTGEITLRGNILPIGGLREKSISAHRSKIKTILIPADNINDLEDIPEEVKKEMNILTFSHYDDVYKYVFEHPKKENIKESIKKITKLSEEHVENTNIK